MKQETYCEGCGKPIAQERVEAIPAVRLCFACAVSSEESEEAIAPEDATAEHQTDEATELTIPAFVARTPDDDVSDDEHTVETDVSELRRKQDG